MRKSGDAPSIARSKKPPLTRQGEAETMFAMMDVTSTNTPGVLHHAGVRRFRAMAGACLLFLLSFARAAQPAGGVKLEQVISREDVNFNCRQAMMTAGRDGKLYFSCVAHDLGFALRVSLDGKEKYGKKIIYAVSNVTANSDGVVASANGHFAHKVTLYDAALDQTGQVSDFLVSDSAGWDAPAHVEAGASGDFYGVDQHRDRIVRLSAAAKVVRIYPIPREPAEGGGQIENFRVCEKQDAFYILTRNNTLRCVGFDGKTRWKATAKPFNNRSKISSANKSPRTWRRNTTSVSRSTI